MTSKTKKTKLAKAETDTNWGKLSASTPEISTQELSNPVTPNFPYSNFPFRLDIKKEKRVCWFQCEEHMNKLIQRENLKPKDFEISTNGIEIKKKPSRKKRAKK